MARASYQNINHIVLGQPKKQKKRTKTATSYSPSMPIAQKKKVNRPLLHLKLA